MNEHRAVMSTLLMGDYRDKLNKIENHGKHLKKKKSSLIAWFNF